MKNNYIISLGGSLIAPDEIDVNFLRSFHQALLRASLRNRFLIIPGGGGTARHYQKVAKELGKVSNDDLDWIGIAANILHSNFLRAIFGKYAHPEIVELNSKLQNIKKSIAIARGGLKPGGTSDSTAVKFAEKFGVKTIINLTNVAGVYDRDPRKFKNAKLIPRMTWVQLKSQFGNGRIPGRHMPFDSSAAALAKKLKLKVAIIDGSNLKNFENFLSGKNFNGTVIQ